MENLDEIIKEIRENRYNQELVDMDKEYDI